MPSVKIADDFYPGISVYKNLRQSPEAVVNRYEDLLRARGFLADHTNLRLLLDVSRELYSYVGEDTKTELEEYEAIEKRKGRPIRGGVVTQFELVYQLLSQILEYVRTHPEESIKEAASLAVIEQFLERKLGRFVGLIWTKIADKRRSSLKRQITKLSRARRSTKRIERKKQKTKTSRK